MRRLKTEGKIDERLMAAWLALMLAGVVMIYSISSVIADSRFGSSTFFFWRQLLWTGLSMATVWFICRLDLPRLAVWSAPALLLVLIPLVVVLFMPARNEAHRWISLGLLSVQPSEIFKFVAVIYLAFSLSNPDRDVTQLRQLLIPYVPLLGTGLLLILLEPNLGNTIVIALTIIGIFFLAGVRIKHLAFAALPMIGVASVVVFVFGYKRARVLDYLAAIDDPLQNSYQAMQAALTLGAGGVLGTGLGEGRQKLFFLPYPHTDFIFAATGEEVGLVGLLILLGLFFYIFRRGLHIAAGQPDRFGYLLAAGVTLSLFVSVAVNVGVVTSLLPVTGLPLPFISYGGSSLLICSAAVGVLLNLSRRVVR